MGKRRGGEAILRNILNISRSKEGKGSRVGSLWCPYGRKEEGNGFYCRGGPPSSTPPSPESPNMFEEEGEGDSLQLEEMARIGGEEGECEGVAESSRRLSEQPASSDLQIYSHSSKRRPDTSIKRKEDVESVLGAKEETREILLNADENEEQNYENFGHLTDKTFSFLGAGSFERCDPLCDSELAAALHTFSSLSLGLSLDTLASRRERLEARSSDILRGPQRLTARSSEALRGSLRTEKSSLCREMRSSLPMLPRPGSPDRWEGNLNKIYPSRICPSTDINDTFDLSDKRA